jgi:hypothetical protein
MELSALGPIWRRLVVGVFVDKNVAVMQNYP